MKRLRELHAAVLDVTVAIEALEAAGLDTDEHDFDSEAKALHAAAATIYEVAMSHQDDELVPDFTKTEPDPSPNPDKPRGSSAVKAPVVPSDPADQVSKGLAPDLDSAEDFNGDSDKVSEPQHFEPLEDETDSEPSYTAPKS